MNAELVKKEIHICRSALARLETMLLNEEEMVAKEFDAPLDLLQKLTQVTGLTIEQIRGESRTRPLSDARILLTHYLIGLGYSYKQIYRIMNRTHHTTIIYYKRQYDSLYAVDDKFRDMADQINQYMDSRSE